MRVRCKEASSCRMSKADVSCIHSEDHNRGRWGSAPTGCSDDHVCWAYDGGEATIVKCIKVEPINEANKILNEGDR